MINKPAKIPERDISSVDITKFPDGLFLGGAQNAPKGGFVKSKDIEIDENGLLTPRESRTKFLPDTVGVSYQKYPVLWNGLIYYFTADDGAIKYCLEGDSGWTSCTGTNTFVTNNGGMTKFLRVLDKVLILNGKNGDKLAYADLTTSGFPVSKYDLVADPALVPTLTPTNLPTGSQVIYYTFSYSGAIGETKLAPIKFLSINKTRDSWSKEATATSMLLTRTGTVPAGALYWNVYIALASSGGVIQDEDMLLLAARLDLSSTTFVDNGTLDINLGSPPPIENSTDGPKVEQGTIADGNPILYADQDNPYNIWIGGGGPYALDFSISNGGYRAEPEKGTNYYPINVIGFRTGQGIPALTVLYSNTEGLSKQGVLQQQTVNYGDTSFSVWGITEQHYGAAGVAAPNSAINYNGRLLFLSTDGFMSMETQPSVQNVLSTNTVSTMIDSYVRSIKTSAMESVVGTGWGNKYMWLVPSYGFETPQEILVLDTNNSGTKGSGAWYTMNIPANWIGVISPKTSPAFVYISQGKSTYKLAHLTTTFDLVGGVSIPFSTNVLGAMVPISGEAHNTWQASVQTVFNLLDIVGEVTVGVNYRNQAGNLKTKSKTFKGNSASTSFAGGWGDPKWTYAHAPQLLGWGYSTEIPEDSNVVNPIDKRVVVRTDDITNEIQWFLRTEIGYNGFKLKAVSYEGINLGLRPDLQ